MASKVNLDIADRLDITCRQGDTFELSLTLKDSAGTALPLSTDSYSFLMQVRKSTSSTRQGSSRGDENLIIGSVESGVKGPVNFEFKSIDDNGNVTIFVSASEMRKVSPGRYVYDLQQRTGDTQKTILEGSFKVNADISKAL
tara:strand:+ start:5194 stop:5619 length:426 start_codon:yes stop_codon:yes gene_type:complete